MIPECDDVPQTEQPELSMIPECDDVPLTEQPELSMIPGVMFLDRTT